MTQDNPVPTLRRWTVIVVSSVLTLGLFVMALLDYAIYAGNSIVIAVCLFLLALLLILGIRLRAQTRRKAETFQLATISQVPSSSASPVLLVLTLLAMSLRLYRLGYESFWYDETWTALASSRPAGQVLRGVNPLPHLVAHLSLWLGRSEFVLRLGPVLAGVLLIPATYMLGRTLYRRNEGVLAAGILTVSVYAIYHSQELRFYAWQMLFSTLTLIFLLRGLASQRRLDWAGFVVTTALNLYSHPFGLFVLASEGIYALGTAIADSSAAHRGLAIGDQRRYVAVVRNLAAPAVCALLALIAFGPGWSHLSSLTSSSNWSVESELAAAGMQRSSWLSTPIATWAYELPNSLLTVQHPALLAAIFFVFFIGLLSSSRRRVALVLLWFLIPPVILIFVRVRFYHRYISYFLPLFVIVVSRGIDYVGSMLEGGRQRLIAVAFLTALVATPSLVRLPDYYQGKQKFPWREVISFIEANHQPGDIVLVTVNYTVGAPEQPIDWYRTLPAAELPWQYFPEQGKLTEPAQLRELSPVTQGYRRVWFLLPAALGVDEISEALQGSFQLMLEQHFVHLKVLLYQAKSTRGPP